ncbi:MAG: NAD(P)/FAD-dependent oxidoreductase [Anaerolineae bacterium]|nr:MAG: NAD(P)/FAD-dependent oxidoreductase [Anaerolineae bacterium]
MRYVIIGTGVAGIAAVEAIRSLDTSGEVFLIGDDPHAFYSRPGLAYYLSGEVPEKQLFPYSKHDYHHLNLHYVRERVVSISPEQSNVTLASGQRLSYDRLLLATGSQAAPLRVPGTDLEGVVKLDHLEDARRIVKLARRTREAVVIGGGITALELVEGLLARKVHVHYFLRGDRYWRNVLDEEESRIVLHRLHEDGVTLHFHTEAAEILGKRGRVVGVRTKDGRVVKCQMVAFAVGIRPRIQLAQEAGLNVDRGILVDETLQTSAPGVYAAGDVAQVFDPLTGHAVLDSLWTPAREQGYVAGLNMAGKRAAYLKATPFNVTRLAGLTTTIIGTVGRGRDEDIAGIARGDSETWRELPEAIVAQSGFDVNRLRLLVGEERLLGAVVMGDQKLSLPLQKIIAGGVDITPIRPKLLARGVSLAEVVADFWEQVRGQFYAA